MIKELLAFNRSFVEKKQYEPYVASKLPNKKLAILSCMDTRLTELLPAALDLKNGDVKLIKNAGAVISSPFGSVMRSLIVAIYELGVEEILIIGHYDCGTKSLNYEQIMDKMLRRGIDQDKIDFLNFCGIDFDKWLTGFDSVEESVLASVKAVKDHPLIPEDVGVYGLVMDPQTGRLDPLDASIR